MLVATVVSLVAGCSGRDRSSSLPATPSASTEPTTPAPAGIAGAHVRVLGLWSGPEFDSFVAVKSVWEQETGAVVDWEPSTDLASSLADQVGAGDPPDSGHWRVVGQRQVAAGGGSRPQSGVVQSSRPS